MSEKIQIAPELAEKAQSLGLNYFEVPPEKSSFYTIGVDVTHRCNMECANCYSPIRNLPDVSMKDLFHFFERLGRKTELRLTGGEPTLRKDLPEIIRKINELGHRSAIMTNGLKLADKDYAATLKQAGLKFVCISMNGADDDDLYLKMDNKKCAEQKVQALKNCSELGFFTNINCIMAKGVNPEAPSRLYKLLKEINIHSVLRFRNIGKLGRYLSLENYTFDEMVESICAAFGKNPSEVKRYNLVNGYEEEHNILFPVDAGKTRTTSWVKITDWRPTENSCPDPNSIRRGRMTKNFNVAPFFEHSKLFGY
jgi:molybdenum cofactor biosynthesis enzyme MoaA